MLRSGKPKGSRSPLRQGRARDAVQAEKTLNEFLSRLVDAIRDGDSEVVSSCVDTDLMFAEIERQQIASTPTPAEKTAFRVALRMVVGNALFQEGVKGGWKNFRLIRQHVTANPMVVDVHALDKDKRPIGLVQLWLAHDAKGAWSLYDWHEASSIFRTSTMVAMTVSAFRQEPNAARWQRLIAAAAHASRGDMAAAERTVLELVNTPLPEALEGSRWLLYAQIKFSKGEAEKALECLDLAIKHDRHMIAVPKVKSMIYAALENPARSLEFARQALATLGHDAEIYALLGNALSRLDRADEAAAAYRKGLDDDPNYVANLAGLAKVLPAEKKGEIAQRLARCAEPAQVFPALADELLTAKDLATVEALLDGPKKPVADPALIDFYRARLADGRGKPADAVRYLEAALAHAGNDESKKLYNDALLDAQLVSGHALEAYRASADPRHAFDHLARQLSQTGNADALVELSKAHLERMPDSVDGYFYQGRGLILAEQFDAAATTLAAGMKLVKSAPQRESFRSNLVFALYKAGKAKTAAMEVGPERSTLDQLATLYLNDGQGQPLIELGQARRQADASDPRPDEWEAAGRMILTDYAGAAKLLKSAIASANTPARAHAHGQVSRCSPGRQDRPERLCGIDRPHLRLRLSRRSAHH